MDGIHDQSVQSPPNYRALKAVVILLGVLIVAALGALVTGMMLGVGPKSPAAQAAEPYSTRIKAPNGSYITGAEIDGNRLVVHIDDTGNGLVVVLDPATGRILGRVLVEPQP